MGAVPTAIHTVRTLYVCEGFSHATTYLDQ